MKKILFPIISFILLLPVLTFASVGKPQGLTLLPKVTTIDVSWESNDDDTDTYIVSWGTRDSALNSTYTIRATKEPIYTHTIKGLLANTRYYVKITALDSKSSSVTPAESEIEYTTTLKGLTPPSKFFIESLEEDITKTSISVTWEKPDMDDLAGYTIYYEYVNKEDSSKTTLSQDIEANLHQATLNDLAEDTRYSVYITAKNELKKESSPSNTLIVDTKDDTKGPNILPEPDVDLIGKGVIRITIKDNVNKGMVDLKEYIVTITDDRFASDGTVPNNPVNIPPIKVKAFFDAELNTSIDVGQGTDHQEIIFENGVTYKITVVVYDQDGNESDPSPDPLPSTTITIADPQNILIDSDEVESGCFVGVLKKDSAGLLMTLLFCVFLFVVVLLNDREKRRTLLILTLLLIVSENSARSEMNNTIGIKAGYFKMSDPLMEETFEDRFPVPVRLYYERTLYKDFHGDLDAGFLKLEGKRITDSGEKTGAQNTFYFMPVSVSFTYNHYLTPIFYAYIGTGLDHWYVREEIANMDANEKQSHYVAGYHYKCGIALLSKEDDIYQKYGIQLETVYAIIDRFGRNDRDLGGFTLQAGYFYRF